MTKSASHAWKAETSSLNSGVKGILMSNIKIYNRTGYQYLSQNWSEEAPDVMEPHPSLILKKDNVMNKQRLHKTIKQ